MPTREAGDTIPSSAGLPTVSCPPTTPPSNVPGPHTDSSQVTPEIQEIPRYYSIRDPQQMVWVLSGNVLITAPSRNNVEPVTLTLIACRDAKLYHEENSNLVYLGIKGKNLCLFCAEDRGQPTLQLQEVNIMDLYLEDKAQKPFLFFHSMEGSTSAFQSFHYPGWFIATCPMPREPIILTRERSLINTNFYLDPEN